MTIDARTINTARAAEPGRKTVTTGLAMEPDLLAMTKHEARRQGRATSAVIRDAIRAYLRQAGYDPPTPFEFMED